MMSPLRMALLWSQHIFRIWAVYKKQPTSHWLISHGSGKNPVASIPREPPDVQNITKDKTKCWLSWPEISNREEGKRVAKSAVEKMEPIDKALFCHPGLKQGASKLAKLRTEWKEEAKCRWTLGTPPNDKEPRANIFWGVWKYRHTTPLHPLPWYSSFYLTLCPKVDTIDLNGLIIHFYCHRSLRWPTQLPCHPM